MMQLFFSIFLALMPFQSFGQIIEATRVNEAPFLQMVQTLRSELSSESSRVTMAPRGGSGQSCYAVISLDGKQLGLFSAPGNSSGNIESEASSWPLAKIFGVEDAYQPAAYVTAGRWAQEEFVSSIDCTEAPSRYKNKERVLSQLNYTQQTFLFKHWDSKPQSYDSASTLLTYVSSSPNKIDFNFKGNLIPASKLTRQLSTALLIDALQGQWDRWSGGNVQFSNSNSGLNLAWFDNGGASFDYKLGKLVHVETYSRYAVNQLYALNFFLNGSSTSFQGFTNEDSLQIALNILSQSSWNKFKSNVRKVSQHVRESAVNFVDDDGVLNQNTEKIVPPVAEPRIAEPRDKTSTTRPVQPVIPKPQPPAIQHNCPSNTAYFLSELATAPFQGTWMEAVEKGLSVVGYTNQQIDGRWDAITLHNLVGYSHGRGYTTPEGRICYSAILELQELSKKYKRRQFF